MPDPSLSVCFRECSCASACILKSLLTLGSRHIFLHETHFPSVTYHGELDGVKRVAGKNLSVEAGIDHRRLNFLFRI